MLQGSLTGALRALGAVDAYLLAVLAASLRRGRPGRASRRTRRLVVLVPAHDEEAGIGACLAALHDCPSPVEMRIVVIADNCADQTGSIAAAGGAQVLHRTDPDRRGKGWALNWALDRMELRDDDGVVLLDADCLPSAGMLEALVARLDAGAPAAQVAYEVRNPEASAGTAARAAAFILMNRIRPAGRAGLGGSAGLLGTGMAFEAGVLQEHRFDPASLVEDADLHLRLVLAGRRVAFAPEAAVVSDMPSDAGAEAAQQARWEGGRAALVRNHGRALAGRAARGDRAAAFALADLVVVPPMTVLAALHAGAGAVSLLAGQRARRLAGLDAVLFAGFVAGGLVAGRAPRTVWAGLAGAPRLVARKLRLLGGLARHGAPTEWQRTARNPPG